MKNFLTIPNPDTHNPEVVENFRHNLFANLLDATFWFFGDSFVAAYTIFPVFMSTLTDSPILIGLIPALEGAGWFLPQLFMARNLEGKNRRLPTLLTLGIFERLSFLLLGFGAFMIPTLSPVVAIGLILTIYAMKTFLSGLVALPWQELIATVIPVSHRGRYWGLALILGKLMGMFGAVVAGLMLANIEYPFNYAYMFVVAFICVSISFIFLSQNKEPEIERHISAENDSLWLRTKQILKTDRNFRIYLVNRAFLFLGLMGLGFVTVYGIQRFNLPVSYSATFTAVMMISEIVGYGIWGTIGDARGYKQVIVFSNLLLVIGLFGLLLAKSLWALYIVFGMISMAYSGEYIADQNIAMEFGEEANRPTYIGMSKTLTGPFLLIAPIIAGWLVNFWGYQSMFIISLIVSIIAFIIIRFFVVEPRLSA